MHRVHVEGAEHIPLTRAPGPLIVVLNHTAGIDPLLAQSVVPFEIRWLMMTDMRAPSLEWFWRFANVIFVDQRGGVSGAREAIRHVKAGGVIGIFPEGGSNAPASTSCLSNPAWGSSSGGRGPGCCPRSSTARPRLTRRGRA